MADEDEVETEEGEGKKKGGKKKLILMIIVLLVIGYEAASMTILKPPPLTAAQQKAKKDETQYQLDLKCALANGLPLPMQPADTVTAPKKGTKTTTTTMPTAEPLTGPVLEPDSQTLNLDSTHYLKVGLALQLAAGLVPDTVKTTENWDAIARQLAIDNFTGRSSQELSQDGVRERLEKKIAHDLCEQTQGQVVTLYFTDFVTQ
jgi:flagellar FliL protein